MSALSKIRWIDLPSMADSRGVLTAIESGRDTPFEIKRLFYMHHIVAERGGHAHRETDQVVVALAGSFTLYLSDGQAKKKFEMNDATRGLFIPKMVFIDIKELSRDAVCLVLANTHYDIKKSIRSWEDYLKEIGQ